MERLATYEEKYPVGEFSEPASFDKALIPEWIKILEFFPQKISDTVNTLSDSQLDTPYRPQGWTIRQLVHHVADSHMNAYCRFKLALTESNPTIRPYDQAKWALLPDSASPADISLNLIKLIHFRWCIILNSMNEEDFRKTYFHPEYKKSYTLFSALANYEWHSRHHLAHITNKIENSGW